MAAEPKEPSRTIVDQQRALLDRFPFSDTQDFDDADHGFLGTLPAGQIKDSDGRPVWDLGSYDFLTGDAPDSVNPSLWRQSLLAAKHGLYEVVEGIYQVRGFDLSNTTFVEGEEGVVVIDPLLTRETAAAALALYREHRGNRPVTAMVYTHAHADHFGGVKGMITQEEADSGKVPVIAPEAFMEHAISENVYAGTAMSRRSAYMYGAALARGPRGQVGAGLGQTVSTGEITLIPPTREITTTGQEEVVDGVRMVFQMAPDTEAPAEMLIYFPDHKALCTAEDATHTFHNLLTLRGAVVRDPHGWSGYLTEAIDLFGGKAETVFASHHWPVRGAGRVIEFLTVQRDLYGYVHDQTLRLLNKGLTGPEIAEELKLPPVLEKAWSTHGYYGSLSHNVKAVYQRYMGWFDGNPVNLWQHPPRERAVRYLEAFGGADAALALARTSFDAGDYRWAAELLDHVVFARPDHAAARELLADTYEQLGYGAENGTWRNWYLAGASELRDGRFGTPTQTASRDIVSHLSPRMLFDALAVQIDGPRAWNERLSIDVRLTDTGDHYRLRLVNGVLTHTGAEQHDTADATVTLPRASLRVLVGGTLDTETLKAAGIHITGDTTVLSRLAAVLDPGDDDFAIVTP
ncbi:alkyl sulfatase dimerization domain-containing protein [Streptomyces sp. NPDC006995]|uniref:alkyl/aryl-sulfatase n=1 Tax=Streptomyces sp. NPDC006995 TaxID=3156907 RepID=UPI0033D4F1ED